MSDKKHIFHKGWVTAGGGELWNCDSTYCFVPASLLPVLDAVDEDLLWLDDVSAELREAIDPTATLDSDENEIAHLDRIVQEINEKGLLIPESFVKFMRDPALHAKVPSCTACYLALSDNLVPVDERRFVLRFLNDQQSCVMWYLLLSRDAAPQVLASDLFFERDIFDALNYEEDPIDYAEVMANALICADSFAEFLYRFWIENTIWFSLSENLVLTPRQQAYRALITTRLQ